MKLLTGWTAKVNDDASQIVVTLDHKLPKRLGTQQLFVTLKDERQERIERQELRVTGTGSVAVTFDLPNAAEPQRLNLAAFLGKDFQSNLQHVTGTVAELTQAK